jgi:2-octaprenylphenol hydroxylase
MTNKTDIVVVGGGLVGAVFACAAAQQGFTVTLLDIARPDFSSLDHEADIRVSAVTRASQKILESIGAWSFISPQRCSPYSDMHVWDATGDGVIHFDSADLGEPDLGHIIENGIMLQALYKVIQQQAEITVVAPIKVTAIHQTPDVIEVCCEDGSRYSAALLVGADGARSAIRELAGITTRGWAYDQTAVVATLTTEKPHQHTAWQRFMPSGPLAFLPMADGKSSIVWSTSPEHAGQLLALDDAAFCHAVGEAFAHRLGKITACSKRASFPLRMQHANAYVKPRLALIGDAAHTIHPLAGQGVNLGFADAASLLDVLADARKAGKDSGEFAVLRRYERWRKGQNVSMMASMDGFKRLFSNDSAVLGRLRNAGFNLMNKTTPIKNRIMRQAMGISGDLSKYARK